MLYLTPNDDDLASLQGVAIPSERQADVVYRVEGPLGGGGMSMAFKALRAAPDGEVHVAIKILRPSVARDSANVAALSVQKEAVALGRLNERVPATPFVVRLIDAGTIRVHDGARVLDLPWLAIEYIHGGVEGTTLDERIRYSLRFDGHAFDPDRAANAVACLASGLTAIHEVGVLHRDLKPGNVLACGFGADEILKIADFGIARPKGMTGTFGGAAIGTPGYAPPEQCVFDEGRMGPWSDVFSLAGVIFQLLTGEEYFQVQTPVDGILAAQRPERRKLTDTRGLIPELRARPSACATIDAALARATAPNPDHRPRSADVLAAMIVPALARESGRGRYAERRAKSLIGRTPTLAGRWAWTSRHHPGGDLIIRSVAWDADGRCLAATSTGLSFWSGTAWQRPSLIAGLPDPGNIHFVRRIDPKTWLLGGNGATLYGWSPDGVWPALRGPDPSERFELASGDVDDLAVFVGKVPGEPPRLHGVAAGHWIKPAVLSKASSITSLSRLDAERWLVTGRAQAGDGFSVMYEPLQWEVKRVKTPKARAYLACATRPELGLGLLAGTEGKTIRFEKNESTELPIDTGGEPPDISAVALDPEGRAWAASMGRIWTLAPQGPSGWKQAWASAAWAVPIVSLFADTGRVIAMTADGGILEGRAVEDEYAG